MIKLLTKMIKYNKLNLNIYQIVGLVILFVSVDLGPSVGRCDSLLSCGMSFFKEPEVNHALHD